MSKYSELVSFKTTAEQADDLFMLSNKSRVPVSEIIRTAIEIYLSDPTNDPDVLKHYSDKYNQELKDLNTEV